MEGEKMKKLLCLLLAMIMIVSLTACGGTIGDKETSSVSGNTSAPANSNLEANDYGVIDFDEEPYNIVVNIPITGDVMPDLDMVVEKVNEITLKEINSTITIETFSIATSANFYALKASGGEKMDLMMLLPGSSYLASYANSNLIQPIDDVLAEWGPDIQEVCGDILPSGSYEGLQWAIPQNGKNLKKVSGFAMSVDLLDKYGFSVDDVKNLDDVEEIFAVIQKNEPNLTVLGGGSDSSVNIANTLLTTGDHDTCGTDFLWINEQEDGSLAVECKIESEAFMEACLRVRNWYETGYISKDINTSQTSGRDMFHSGNAFSYIMSANHTLGETEPVHSTVALMKNNQYYLYTGDNQTYLWAIANTCERPDKCIQFLNLCVKSAELTNLLKWGVEDVHYEVIADGTIDPFNMDGYRQPMDIFGDAKKQYVRTSALDAMGEGTTAAEYWEAAAEFDKMFQPSAVNGFMFNPENVKTEVAACDNVCSEYLNAVGNGAVDPETEIPKFVKKLYDAGMQEVIDEMQKQLDDFLANKQ